MSNTPLRTLTLREQAIASELLSGSRVANVADSLAISPHTVRNHLRSIFYKLGVNSQPQLIQYLRLQPELVKQSSRSCGPADPERLMAQDEDNDRQMQQKINAVFEHYDGRQALQQLCLEILPTDTVGRQQWRLRAQIWSAQLASAKFFKPRIERNELRRRQTLQGIEAYQHKGVLRADISPEHIAKLLYCGIRGLALELLNDSTSGCITQSRQLVDTLLDSICIKERPYNKRLLSNSP